VKRGSRIALFSLAGFAFLGLSGLSILFGIPLIKGQHLEREFMSHALNQKIVARNPNWSHSLRAVDITDLFESGTRKADFESELTKIGYRCGVENASESKAFCDREAGFSFVCRKIMLVGWSYDARGIVDSVSAYFNLVCL
jgi:hypothetical protein